MTLAQMGFSNEVGNVLAEIGASMLLVYSRRCILSGVENFLVEVGTYMISVQVGFFDEVRKILAEVRPYMALTQIGFPDEVNNVLVEVDSCIILAQVYPW